MYQLPALYAKPASATADKRAENISEELSTCLNITGSKTRDIYGDGGDWKHFYF